MKKIGLLGGMAWPSTVDYYRGICAGANAYYRERGATEPLPVPWITIESVNIAETRALRGVEGDETSWRAYDAVLRATMLRLEAAGCEVLAMASNTPHNRLHAFCDDLSVPVVSILDSSAKVAIETGMNRALVLGTSVTMRGSHYPRVLAANGLEALPQRSDVEIDRMQSLIDTEFYESGTSAGKSGMLDICHAAVDQPDNTVVLLACTELPLAYPKNLDDSAFDADGFTFVNTGAAHVNAILDAALDRR